MTGWDVSSMKAYRSALAFLTAVSVELNRPRPFPNGNGF